MAEAFAEVPPVPAQPDWTIETDCSLEGATALSSGPDTVAHHTHVERINPSWGTNGGWVPGTGIPHAYDAQMELERAAEAEKIEAEARVQQPMAAVKAESAAPKTEEADTAWSAAMHAEADAKPVMVLTEK